MANVKVAVRVRPLNSREVAGGGRMVIGLHEDSISITNIKMNDDDEVDHRERVRHFSFDYTYWSVEPSHPRHALQHMIYGELGAEVIDAAVEGYNACVLAYGQSGSGKTYTIMGTQEEPGLAPRVCEGLLARLRQLHHQGGLLEYSLTLSLVEIYKERVRDLLATGPAATRSLRVREHPRTGPYVEGVTRHAVREAGEAWALLERGRSSRSVAPTATHGESSRSHALLTLALTQPRTATHSTLTLVDLAGSERASQERDRARLAEGSNINKSLVTLGTVISALAERGNAEAFSPSGSSLSLVSGLSGGSPPSGGASGILPGPPSSSHSGPPRRQQHSHHSHHNSHQQHQGRLPFIPYRDSVLTWLLRDTLGGNAKTIMIATVSPSSTCFTESLGTLRYAARTRNIVNRPVVNEDPSAATIRSLRQEVSRLTKLLQYTTKSGALRVDGGTSLLDLICDAQCRAAQLTHDWVNRWHGGGAGAGGSHLTTDRWRGSGHLPPEGDGEEEDRGGGALCSARRQLSASTGQLCSAPIWVRHSCSSLSSLEAIHSGAGLTVKRNADGSGEGHSCGSEVSTLDPSPRRERKGGRGCGGEGLCLTGGREMSPRREYKGGSVGVPSAGGTSVTTAGGGCRRQLVVDTQYPYLLNTPHDFHADAIVIHHLQTAETVVGSGGGDEGVSVTLRGPHVSPRHCSLFTSRGATFLSAYADGEVAVNGSKVPVGSSVRLHEGDLLALGSRRFTFHEATRPLPKPPPLAAAAAAGSGFLMSSVSSSASSSEPMTTSFVSSEVSSACQDGGVPGGNEVPLHLLPTSSASSSAGLRCSTPTSSASSTYHVADSITTTAAAQDTFHPHVTATTTTNTSISTATAAAATSPHLTASSSSSSSFVPQSHKRGVAASGEYRQCPKRRRGGGDVKAGPASRPAEPPRTTCGNTRSNCDTHGVNQSGNSGEVRAQLGPPFAAHKRATQQPIKCSCCPHSHLCPSCLNNSNNNQQTVDPRECLPHGSRGHLRREGHVTGAPRPTMEGTKKTMKKLSADSVRTSQLRNLWDSVKKSSSDTEYEDVDDLEVEGLMSPLAERTSPIGASHSEGNNSQSRGPDMTDQEDEDEEEEEEDPQPGSCLIHRRQDYGSDTSLDSLGSQHSKASLDSRMYRVSGNSNTYRSSRTFFLDLTGDGEKRPCVSELCSPSESLPPAMPQSPTETRKRWDKSVWPEIEKGLRRNFSVPDMGQDDKGPRRRKRSPSPKQNSLDDKEKRQEIIDAVTRRLYPGSGPGFAKKEKKVQDKPKTQRERLCRCRKKSQSESDSGSNTTPRVPKKSSTDKSNNSTTAIAATTTITTTTSKPSASAPISTSSTSSSTSSSSSKIPSDIISRVPFVRRSSLEAPPGSHIPVPIPGPLRPERDRSPSAAESDSASASQSAKQSKSLAKRETKAPVAAPDTSTSIKTIKPETRAPTKNKTSQYTETKATSQDSPGDANVSKDSSDTTPAESQGRRVLVPIQPNPDLLSDVAEADMMFSQYDSEVNSEKRKIPLTKNLEALQKRLASLSENSEQFSDDSLELHTPDEDAGDPTEPMNLLRRPNDDVLTTSNISTFSKDSLEESTCLESDIKENLNPPARSLLPELCNLGRGMPRSPGFPDLHALTAATQNSQNLGEGATPNPYESHQIEQTPKTESNDKFVPTRAPKLSERHDSFIQSFFRSISHPDRSDTNFEIEEEELSSDEVSSALVTPKFATPAHATPTSNRSLEESPTHVVQDVTNANITGPLPDDVKYESYHRSQPVNQSSSPSTPQQQQLLQPPDATTMSPMTTRRLIRERAERRILDTSSSEDSDPDSRRRTRRRRKHRKTTPPLISVPTIDIVEMQDQSEESDDYLSVLQSSPEKREGTKQEDDARNNNANLNASTVLDNARSLAKLEQVSRSAVNNKTNKNTRKDTLTKEMKREHFQRMGHVEAYSVLTNLQCSSVENTLVPVVDTAQLLQKTATRLRPYSPTIPLTPQNTLEASLSIDDPQFLVGGEVRSHRKDEIAYSLLQPSKPTGIEKKENPTITKLLFASSEKLHNLTEDQEIKKPLETQSPTRSVSRATDLEEDYETAVGEETPWHESSSESRASFRTIEENSTSNVDSEGTTTPVNTESSPDKKQRQKISNTINVIPSFDVTQHGVDKKSLSQENDQFFVPTSRRYSNRSPSANREISDNNGGLRAETQWDPKRHMENLTIESTDSGGGSPAPASPNSEGFSTETSWEEMVLEEVNANQQEVGKCEDLKSMSQYTPSTARRLLYTIVECSESSRSEGACSEPDLIPDDWRDSTSEIECGDDGASADGHLSYNGSEDRLSSSDDTLLDTVRHGEDPQPDSLLGIPDEIYEGKALTSAYKGLTKNYALTTEEGNVTGDSLEHLPTASPSPENKVNNMNFPQTNKEGSNLTTSTALTKMTANSMNRDSTGLDKADTSMGNSQKSQAYPITPQNSFMEGFGTENQNAPVDPNKLSISLRTEFPPMTPQNSICCENYDRAMVLNDKLTNLMESRGKEDSRQENFGTENQNSPIDPNKLNISLRTEFPPPTPRNSICYENYDRAMNLKDRLTNLMELRDKEDSGEESFETGNQNSPIDPNKLSVSQRTGFPPPAPRNSICYENCDRLTNLVELRGKEGSGQEDFETRNQNSPTDPNQLSVSQRTKFPPLTPRNSVCYENYDNAMNLKDRLTNLMELKDKEDSGQEDFETRNQNSPTDPNKLSVSQRTKFPPPTPRNSICYENYDNAMNLKDRLTNLVELKGKEYSGQEDFETRNQNSSTDPNQLSVSQRTKFPPPAPRNSICYENYDDAMNLKDSFNHMRLRGREDSEQKGFETENQNLPIDPNMLGISLRVEFPPPTPRNSICYQNYDDAVNNKAINLKDELTDLVELRGKEDSGQESGNISLAEEAYEISDVEETRQEDCETFLESLERSFTQTRSVLSENDGDLLDLVSRSSGDRAPVVQVVTSASAAPVVIISTQSSTPSTVDKEHSAKPFASAPNSSGPNSAKPVVATSSCPVPRATSDQDDLNEEKIYRSKEEMKIDKQTVNKKRTDEEESRGRKYEERGTGDGAVVELDERGKIVKREGTERSSLTQSGRETPLPRHDESQPPISDKRTETSEISSDITSSLSSSTSSSSFSIVKKSLSFGISIPKLSSKKSKASDVEVSLHDNPPTAPLSKANEKEEEEELIRRKLEADMSRYLHVKLKQLEDSNVTNDQQENLNDAKVEDDSKKQNSVDMKESSVKGTVKKLKEDLANICTNTDGQDISGLENRIASQKASSHTKEFNENKNAPNEKKSLRDSDSPLNDGVTLEKPTLKDSNDLVPELKKDEKISSSSQDKKILSSQRLQSLQEMVESIRHSQDYDNWNMRRPYSLDLPSTTMPNQEVTQPQTFKDSKGKDIPAKDLRELIRQNSLPSKTGSLDIDNLLPELRSSLMPPSPKEELMVASCRRPPPRPPSATSLNNDSKTASEVKVLPSHTVDAAPIKTTDQSSNGTANKPKEPKLFLPLKTNNSDTGNSNGRNGDSKMKDANRTRHVEKLTSDSWHGHFIMEHDRSDHWTTSDESITFIFMSPSEEKEADPTKDSRDQMKQVENAYRSSSDLSNIGLSAGIPDEHRKPQYDLYKASHTTRGRLERSASVDSIYIALHKFELIKLKHEIQRTSSLENIITEELEDIIEKGRLFDSNDFKDEEDDEDDDTPVVLSPVQEKKSLNKEVTLDLTEYKEVAVKRAEYEYMKEIASSSDDDVFSGHMTPTKTFGQKAWWDFESLVMGRPPKIIVKASSEESSKSSPQLHKGRKDFSLNKKSVSWTDLDGCGALEIEVPDWTEMQDLVVPITKPKSIMKKPSLEPITSGSTPTPPTPPQEGFTAPQRPSVPLERTVPPPVPPPPTINKTVVDAKNESSSDSDDLPLPRSNLKETFRLQLPEHIRERVRKSSATSSGSSSSSSSSSSKSSGTSSTSSSSSTEEDASPTKNGRIPSSIDKALPPLKEPHSAPPTPSTSFNANPTTTLVSTSRRKSESDLSGGVASTDIHGASQTWMALSKVMMEAGTILRTLSETSLVLHEQLVSPGVQGRRVSLPSLPEETSISKNVTAMTPLLRSFIPKQLVSVGIQTETMENNTKRETRSVLAQTSLDIPQHGGSPAYQRPSYTVNVIDKSETSPTEKTLTVDNRMGVDRNLAQQQDSENANDTGRSELTDNRREDINANVAQSHLVPHLTSPLAGGGGIVDELNLLRNERERLNRLINKYERSSILLTRQSYNLNLRNNNISPMETTATTSTPPAVPSSISPPRNVTETVQNVYEAGNERPPYYKYLSSTSQKYLSLYQKRLEDSCQRLEERLEINAKKRQLRSQLLSNKHSHLSLTSLSGTESPSKLSSTEVKNWSIHGSLDLAQQSFSDGGSGLRLGTGTTSSSSVSLPTMSHCSPSRNPKDPSSSPCCCISPSHRHHQHTLCSSPARTSPFGHSSALCHNLPSHLSDSHVASSSSTTTPLSTQQCRQQLLQLRRKLINASSSMNSSSSSVANSPSSSRPYGSSISTTGTGGVEVGMDIASVTSLRGPYRRSHAASLGELPGGGAALGQVSWSRGLRGSSASVASDTEAYYRLRPQLSLDSDSDSGAFSASGLNLRHTRSNHTFL
ncbi:uncharacterized protein LOC143037419 isoform X2 [Oratosquilla oratoria]|uniref:uncharacterized protein LOC143037419 isoform X2 n=1 Tax=Oratosquilla oratoria TaxID=337810 RepID=UPI003F77150D